MNLKDRILVEKCLNNERKAQKQLVDQYGPAMYAIISRYQTKSDEAEDILQNVFILVFKYLPSFRFDSTIGHWIKRIAINTALKNNKLKWNSSVDHLDHASFPDLSGGHDISSTMDSEYIMQIIQKLPDPYKVVFQLFVIDGYNHSEIANILGITESASRSRLFRSKELLQQKLLHYDIHQY